MALRMLLLCPRGHSAPTSCRFAPTATASTTGSLDGSRRPRPLLSRDLWTVQADRDRFYYGIGTRFERHSAILQTGCS